MKNKQELQNQIEDMKQKLAEMEALLNGPEVSINYWQPKEGEYLYYVDYLGRIRQSNYTDTYQADETRYRVFKTKEEAEKYAEYIKAEETLKRVIAEANAGIVLDWTASNLIKYYINLDTTRDSLSYISSYVLKSQASFMYIKSKELAEKLMKEYEAEFKTYLSY